MRDLKGGNTQEKPRWWLILFIAMGLPAILGGCANLGYLSGEARDTAHQHETLIDSIPSGAICALSEATGRQFELVTPATLPLGLLVAPVKIECRMDGHFDRRLILPRGSNAPVMQKLLQGQAINHEIGPWPYQRAALGSIYPNWVNLFLPQRDFASVAARDRYYGKRKMTRAANWVFTAALVRQECLAGVAGAVVTDPDNLPRICGEALARLRQQRDRDLQGIELDRRRALPAY